MKLPIWPLLSAGVLLPLYSGAVLAHDPVFGIGPHVVFKNGFETAINVAQKKAGKEKDSELGLEVVYGLTADWAAGIDVPYASREDGMDSSNGLADIQVFTKYRFWRQDSLGLQQSAAVLLAINGQNGDNKTNPSLGNGAADVITGLTYGYESIKWYRWVSARYVLPGKNSAGYQLGNKWLLDIVGGWRPTPPEYTKPDTVWLLELNGEITDKATFSGNTLTNSGGTEWFISPGIFWTTRNFAIKAGVQLPITSHLNGNQSASDYRVKMTFEWHF